MDLERARADAAVCARERRPLALSAAENALRDSGLRPAEITHLITVSCTGFFSTGPDIALIKQLGLNPEVSRLHIGFMGCHGALNGLRQCSVHRGRRPACTDRLLCAVELCSLHLQYGWNPHSILANSLFADGAGAVVLARTTADGSERQTHGASLLRAPL